MKKAEQMEINVNIEIEWGKAYPQYLQALCDCVAPKRLRTCSARVIETEDYYFLVSYSTMVAFISKETDTLYDALRWVWGYTSTSAQHIAKFRHDYGQGKWGVSHELRWYHV